MEGEIKKPEAILFDLGSTLLKDSFSGGLNDRVRAHLSPEIFTPYVKEGFQLPNALADTMDRIYHAGMEEFHVKSWLSENLLDGITDLNGSPETLEKHIRLSIIHYSSPEDSVRVLRDLTKMEIPMAVVSNTIFSAELLRNNLEEHFVLDAFQFVVSSAEFGMRKPHPSIFLDACKQLGSEPAKTWYVGDLWVNDVIGSTAAGLVPVWLNATAETPSDSVAHLRVRNWTELGKLLGV
ncbi:MAG: hypothetical protein CMI18_01430 [Opitutaceae bacterium]|nr:hypothetical protein [Opitutaceae bacterium]|tara:strand:+ start:5585 stop:6295 length:711 start_codon:yes stop_codon:yes gene_type:complete